jgi:two-component system CheB/CheR fusion protein
VAFVPGEGARIRDALSSDPFELISFDSAEALMPALAANGRGCVVAPADLPGIGMGGLIRAIRTFGAHIAVVAVGRDGDDLRVAVDLIRAGAAEFVEAPISAGRLRAAVRRAAGTVASPH